MKQFQFVAVWKVSHLTGHYVDQESHDKYELVYYRNGHGTSQIGDKKYTFHPNTFFIIPPNTIHDESHKADCSVYFMRFHCQEDIPCGLFEDPNEDVYRILKTVRSETLDQKADYKDMITLKLNELLILLERDINAGTKPNMRKNFEYIINYLSENYREKILLKTLADQMNYSYDYFQHQFRELTGYSPQKFLINKRLATAETMLNNSTLSCTEIAFQCGFSNSAQFSAIFKREKGMTPQAYRKKLRIESKH